MDIEYSTALAPGDYDADELRAALVGRAPYSLGDSEDPANLTALVDGRIPLSIIWNQILFHLDPADTTTAADNVTVIKTADNYVYKVEAPDYRIRSALSDTVTAPPGSPAIGDIYLVPSGATGAWSSHQDDIAIYTRNGWKFETPGIGKWLLIESTDGFKRYTASGWVYGPGARSFDASSVPFSSAIAWGQRFIVEDQTTNTPPTATLGLCYVVGSAPTGAWAGKALKIAICEVAGTWTFYTPKNGTAAYDKSLSAAYTFNGTAWITSAGAWAFFTYQFTQGTGSTTQVNGSDYAYSNSTPPTTSARLTRDDVSITRAAARIGAIQRFRYQANFGSQNAVVIGLFVDSGSNAVAWTRVAAVGNGTSVEFILSAGDTSSHVYKIIIIEGAGHVTNVDRRQFTYEESP